jgi:hypothetical protein
VVRRFLKDIEDGRYDHYVDIGMTEFPLHNPAMRRALKLPDDGMGVLVTSVIPTSSCDGVLKPGDVLLALNGHSVDSAGMVTIDGEKTNMNEIVERRFAGDTIAATFIRDGKREQADIVLKPLPASRMYAIQYEKKPRYVVFAGLVFQPLDTNLFASAKFEDVTVRRLYTDYLPKALFQKHRDIVVLTRVENDPVNSRLADFTGYALDKINGVKVTDLAHANELLHPAEAPEYFVIELFGASRPLVIPSSEVAEANKRIARNYGITQPVNLTE